MSTVAALSPLRDDDHRAARPQRRESTLECRLHAGGVEHDVGAVDGDVTDGRAKIVFSRVEGDRGAEARSERASSERRLRDDHDGRARGDDRLQHRDPDRPCAQHGDRGAQQVRCAAHGVYRDRERLGERGLDHPEAVGHRERGTARHDDQRRQPAVQGQPVSTVERKCAAQVRCSPAARRAVAAPLDRGHRDRAPRREVVDAVTHGAHRARELVAEDHAGDVQRGGARSYVRVEIAAADPIAGHLDEHLPGPRLGLGDLLDAEVPRTMPHRCLHALTVPRGRMPMPARRGARARRSHPAASVRCRRRPRTRRAGARLFVERGRPRDRGELRRHHAARVRAPEAADRHVDVGPLGSERTHRALLTRP